MNKLKYDYVKGRKCGPAAVRKGAQLTGFAAVKAFVVGNPDSITAFERFPLHERVLIRAQLKRLERKLIARAKAERPRVYCDPVIHAGRGKSAVLKPSHVVHKDFWREVAREAQK